MTTAIQDTNDARDQRAVLGDEPAPAANGGSVRTSRASFARFGLETQDVLIVTLGTLLVVAYGPFFWSPLWTPRAALLLAALPFGMYELTRLARSRDKAAAVALVVIGWAIITSLLSDAPWVSLLPASERHEGAWVMAGALGCWALGRTLSAAARQALGVALIGACALNGVIGVFQVVLDIQTGPLAAIGQRATGLSTNPIYFGATMVGAVAWCAWTFSAQARSSRTDLALLGVALGSFFVTMSGSRVALVALLFFVALAIVRRASWRSAMLVPAVIVGAVAGSMVQRLAVGEGSSATDRVGNGGLGPRLQIWQYGWKAFLDRPFTGYGLGRYRPAVQRFFDADFVTSNQGDDLLEAWFESHNIIVQMTVGMGIVGLVLLVAFVAVALRDARGSLLWAVGAITVTWLLQPARLVTFPLVALLLGASQPALRHTAAHGARVTGQAMVGVGVCVSAVMVGWVVVADLQVRAATSSPSLAASARAVRWSPWDPLVANEAATLIYDADDTDERAAQKVLAWNEKAAELEPDFPYWWMRLGIRQMVLEDTTVARRSFERAIDLQPYHPISLKMLSVIAREQGDDDLLRVVDGRLEALGFTPQTGSSTAGT
jgi:O-antigen ligase